MRKHKASITEVDRIEQDNYGTWRWQDVLADGKELYSILLNREELVERESQRQLVAGETDKPHVDTTHPTERQCIRRRAWMLNNERTSSKVA